MKFIFNIIAYVSFLALLSGCLWGNGEGYGRVPTGNSAPSVSGVFYEVLPDYPCAFKRAIEINKEQITLSNGCDNSIQTLSLSELEVSLQNNYLGYQEGIFEKRELPPVLGNPNEIFVETFCTRAQSSTSPYLEIVIKNSSVTGYPQGDFIIWFTQFISFHDSVRRSESSNQRLYESQNFSLIVNLDHLPDNPFKHGADLNFSVQGITMNEAVSCRLLKP